MHEVSLFEAILHTNIINFIIVIYILRLVFKKANLGALLDKLAEEVKNSIDKSNADAKKAMDEYKNAEDFVKDTEYLQKQIKKQAKLSIENITKRIEEKTTNQQNELKQHLHKVFDSQTKEFKNLTYKSIFKASVALAKEEVLKRLDDNMHKKLINTSIDELDKIEGSLY